MDSDIEITHISWRLKNTAILLPLAFMLNREIGKAEIGQTLIMADKTRYKIINKTIIPLNNKISDCIALHLYNLSISEIVDYWRANYGKEVSDTECYYLILKKIDKNKA